MSLKSKNKKSEGVMIMEISKEKRLELREKAKSLEPILRVGKNGINDEQLKEIKATLQRRKLIKVKVLPSYAEDKDKKAIAREVAEKTNSILIDQVGFVVVLYRP